MRKTALRTSDGLAWKSAEMALTQKMRRKKSRLSSVQPRKAAMKVCHDAVQILGAHGLEKHQFVEKWYRDIKVFDIFEGTGQIQRIVISKRILKEPPNF